MLPQIAGVLYKRLAPGDTPPEVQLPPWALGLFLVNLIVFLPVIIYVTYTLKQIYPALAITEDPNPPAYDPVPPTDDDLTTTAGVPTLTDSKPRPITSSLRSTHRALTSAGGIWRSSLRGLTCLLAQRIATTIVRSLLTGFFPYPLVSLAALLASLALAQLSATWVHIIISPPSPRHFFQRLPPFRRAFDATARPIALLWAADQASEQIPLLIAYALGLPIPRGGGFPHRPDDWSPPIRDGRNGPSADPNLAWKALVLVLVSFALFLLLQLPARVVLVRVQASLLPPEDDTIIPFDRSFQGRVEPAVVAGRGFATATDAWQTFGREAWKRLLILSVKVYFLGLGIMLLVGLVLAPQIAFVLKHAHRKEPQLG